MSEVAPIKDRRRMDTMSVEKLFIKLDKISDKVDSMTLDMNRHELMRETTDIRIEQVMKAAHKRIDDAMRKITAILDNQNNIGCPVLQRSEAIRRERMKAYDKEIEIAKAERQGIRDYVEQIKDLPNKILFRVVVSIATAGALGIMTFYLKSN